MYSLSVSVNFALQFSASIQSLHNSYFLHNNFVPAGLSIKSVLQEKEIGEQDVWSQFRDCQGCQVSITKLDGSVFFVTDKNVLKQTQALNICLIKYIQTLGLTITDWSVLATLCGLCKSLWPEDLEWKRELGLWNQ